MVRLSDENKCQGFQGEAGYVGLRGGCRMIVTFEYTQLNLAYPNFPYLKFRLSKQAARHLYGTRVSQTLWKRAKNALF